MSGALSGDFWNFMQKGPSYYWYRKAEESSGSSTDQIINKNYNTFKEYYELVKRFDSLLRGSGSHDDPALTCRDLFINFPEKPEGEYWIDPNEGSHHDAILVSCNKTTSETCIWPKMPTHEDLDSFADEDKWEWAFKENLGEKEGVAYASDLYQLKMMKLLSDSVRQNVTYFCKNSEARVQIMTDDDSILKPGGSRQVKTIVDDCKKKDNQWRKAAFEIQTTKLDILPVQDIAAFDIGNSGESHGIEIGPVCFS